MENFIQILILIHATLGGIALASRAVAMVAKKGMKAHRKAGKTFYYTMVLSAITAMVISLLPNHHNPFLFSVGVFSLYLVLTGYRALQFKKKNHNLDIDIGLSLVMMTTGICMILLPVFVHRKINIVLTVFGVLAIILVVRNLIMFRDMVKLRKNYLKIHLGNMIGGYISAFTAFVVVNQFLPPLISWLGPGVIGGFYIAYWLRKVDKTKATK